MPTNQNHPSTPNRARPAGGQQTYDSPAGYYSTTSFERYQASTPTRTRPAVEQNHIPPNTAYPSTLSPSQNQPSALRRARPAFEQQNYASPATYAPAIPSNQHQASTPTIARPVIEQHNYGPRNRALEHGPRDRAGFFATVLNPDTNAATPAHDNSVQPSEQRTQAQLDAVGQDRAASTSRDQADAASRFPPIVTAGANSAVAVSEGRETMDRIFEAEQRIRAETNAMMLAERNRTARLFAARENMQGITEDGQRVRAQWDAMVRDKAASAAREQVRVALSYPSTSTADVNRAGAPLAARDGRHDAAQDSFFSSPVVPSARAPQFQAVNTSPGTPMTLTTAPGHHSTVDQHRPRAPRTTEELLQIKRTDPQYFQLTDEEKRDRTKAMRQARYVRERKEIERRRGKND